MNVLFPVLVTFFAGMGAGLGTGFAGMSAAAVISPMLITFLHMDPYMAVGIALSSDVLASAVSAYTYHKNKNLDIKNGLIMMASVLAFTVVGSWVASKVPSATMGGFSVFMTFLLGVKFILRPVMTTKEAMEGVSPQKRAVQSVVCGVLIGLICGFIGAGGGMMMLLILTSVLGYELKTAVGTSVFIMTFTALTGAVSHFMIGGAPDWGVWVLCVLFTLLWARIAAVFANKATPKTLNRATGVVLVVLGIKFILRPVMTTKEAMQGVSAKKRAVQSLVCGMLIGFICGFIGAGGGMMMLLILTSVLGYELKTAVGTSVFIMTFTALTGAVSHFMIGGAPDWGVWVLCVVFTLLWARIAAVFANKAAPKTLNRATGVVLVVLGIVIMGFKLLA